MTRNITEIIDLETQMPVFKGTSGTKEPNYIFPAFKYEGNESLNLTCYIRNGWLKEKLSASLYKAVMIELGMYNLHQEKHVEYDETILKEVLNEPLLTAEETKYNYSEEEIVDIVKDVFKNYPNLKIKAIEEKENK